MAEVVSNRDRLTATSIARLAEGLRMDRKTVSKRIAEANIAPHSMRDGYPVYPFREAVEACVAGYRHNDDGNEVTDPRLLPPDKRKQWYQSEESRLSVEARTRQLIPAAEVESEFADLIKSLVQFLDTLPDALERDCALSPEQVDRLHTAVDRQRKALHERLVSEDPQEATA